MSITLENQYMMLSVAANGLSQHFIDKSTGKDYCSHEPTPFASITRGGREIGATEIRTDKDQIHIQFGDSQVSAILKATNHGRYLVLEVLSLRGEDVEQLRFAEMPLTLSGSPEEPFAACALALNLKTNVSALPGPCGRLQATAYQRLGFEGAKVALIGCPQPKLRGIIQEVVRKSEELPCSPLGGPWAQDSPDVRGSYLFDFNGMTEDMVDDWIELVQSLGLTEVDFHGGGPFRFGDCRPNPARYPQGFDSLKAVIDRLHEANLRASLHTYAFLIAKDTPWVTPVPDSRLGKDATFTLAQDLSENADAVQVQESTESMSTVTGFFVRNSVTLQVEDELIIYTGISKEPPYAFTGCTRGAHGTRITSHPKGVKVHHLKEVFGLFAPDGDSTLFAEVAAKTAEAFNYCGFDNIYLDALDSEDICAGREYGWHYGSKFAFELAKRLDKPALMEMSTFHHHLWYLRSRMGAWDHPSRSYKKFIDNHCAANERNKRIFMPSLLGWWAIKPWNGPQVEPTLPDDIEYLCCKGLGNDTGLALMGIGPDSLRSPAMQRLAEIMKRWENLRHSGNVPESIKVRLREPGKEFTLEPDAKGGWQFRPICYDKHRVEGMDGRSNTWQARNDLAAQPLRLRIEALQSAAAYDSPESKVIADFINPAGFTNRRFAPGIAADLSSAAEPARPGTLSGRFSATNQSAQAEGAWAMLGLKYQTPIDLSAHQGLGVWVYGDGQGELLNLQLCSPVHVSEALGEHYIPIDFTGWRYFELIEPDAEHFAKYRWPYDRPEADWNNTTDEGSGILPHWILGQYHIYRENLDFKQIESLNLWYNNLPPAKSATTFLSPIKALPLINDRLISPKITLGGKTLVFPIEIESGCYLEFNSATDCRLYGPQGQPIRDVKPEGDIPLLESGPNQIGFSANTASSATPRTRITVITQGPPL